MSKEVFVYVICEQTDLGRGPVKVGMSDNPWYRAISLSAGNPRKLDVFRVFSMPTRREARELEQLFHRRNSEFRVHGEWFNKTPGSAGRHLEELTKEILESLGFADNELQTIMEQVFTREPA